MEISRQFFHIDVHVEHVVEISHLVLSVPIPSTSF